MHPSAPWSLLGVYEAPHGGGAPTWTARSNKKSSGASARSSEKIVTPARAPAMQSFDRHVLAHTTMTSGLRLVQLYPTASAPPNRGVSLRRHDRRDNGTARTSGVWGRRGRRAGLRSMGDPRTRRTHRRGLPRPR